MKSSLNFFCVTVIFILWIKIQDVNSQNIENYNDIYEYSEPKFCTKYEFFNAQKMSCEKCPNDFVSSKNQLKCICDKNSRIIKSNNGSSSCEICENGTVLTSDGNDCIPCQTNGICQCLENEIKVERYVNGTLLENLQCLPCPDNSYISIDKTKCLPCSKKNYEEDLINTPTFSMIHHHQIQNKCLENTLENFPNIHGMYLINYHLGSFDSYFLRTELKLAIYLCQNESCGYLENICTLTTQIDSIPCQLLIKITSRKRLFYPAGEAEKILSQRNNPTRYTLLNNDENNQLKFLVTKYTLTGEVESISNLSSANVPKSFSNIRFGINTKQTIWTSIKNLLNKEMEFFIPYLQYTTNNNDDKFLHQLPILVNKNNIINYPISKWQLIKKFFTIDTVTGHSSIIKNGNSSIYKSSELIGIRYLKKLKIEIKIQERRERGKIFTPFFIVDYGELTQNDINENFDIPIEYEVKFSLTDEKFSNSFFIAIGVSLGVAVIFAILKIVSHKRRNSNASNFFTIIWFIIYCLGNIGNAMILVTMSTCVYTFIFFKGQTVLHILLPDDDSERIFKLCTIISFVLKFIEVLALLWRLRNVNIFFIDWEQPRNLQTNLHADSPHTSLKKSYLRRFPLNDASDCVQTPSEIIGARRNPKTPSKSSQLSTPSRQSISRVVEQTEHQLPSYIDENFTIDDQDFTQNWMVSIWRTYFVANQWLKIKTQRNVSIVFQMIGIISILEIIGLKNWNTAVPEFTLDLQKNQLAPKSFTLNYAIIGITYILVYIFQWIISIFQEKYVKNVLRGFVDLCSVANISIFILSNDNYGYYIHGRSVHGFADTDLLSLINDLKREENNLCAHRGLIPGTTEQTFVICVSNNFKLIYNSLLGPENMSEKKINRRNLHQVSGWEERWKMNIKMKKFLCGFLDHCFKNIDYMVKEKHVIEKLCDMEIFDSPEKSVFYIDDNYSFDQTLFYGNELTLATFELTTFLFITVLGGSYILSALITIILSKLMDKLGEFDRNKILANKTMIDERFLTS